MALNTKELFTGLYCRVIIFIISCDTQPPENIKIFKYEQTE